MRQARYIIYALAVCAALAVYVRSKRPPEREIPLGANFPVEEEIHLEREIVLIDDAPGHGKTIATVSDHVRARFGLPTRIEKRTLDASPAYHEDRDQWDAATLVRMWRGVIANGAGRIVIVTGKDTFAEGLNWTTGCAMCGGQVAVVSICRLRNEFWGDPPNEEKLTRRAITIVMHELGHTWGKAAHCTNECVIGGTNSLRDIDGLPTDYCPFCRRLARKAVGTIRETSNAPHETPSGDGRSGTYPPESVSS